MPTNAVKAGAINAAWNTGREYSENKQRVSAQLLPNGRVAFLDVDRHIEGISHNVFQGEVIGETEVNPTILAKFVMAEYDNGRYNRGFHELNRDGLSFDSVRRMAIAMHAAAESIGPDGLVKLTAPPVYLSVEAHDLTLEFEANILEDYGVTVTDRANEPWCVVFEGQRESLISMYNKHWGGNIEQGALTADSEWISETRPQNRRSAKSEPSANAAKLIPVTMEQTIKRMKREIIEDVLATYVPVECKSFSDLHSYRDANAYGGFCEDALSDALIEYFGGRDTNEGMPDEMISYINQAQEAVDSWLEFGGLINDCPPQGWRFVDQNTDDELNPYGIKAYFSVYEKRIGGNGYPTCDLTILLDGHQYCAAHGGVVMGERAVSAIAAAEIAIGWAVENGWSNDELSKAAVSGMAAPIQAFPATWPNYSGTEKDTSLNDEGLDISENPKLTAVVEGMFNGRIMDVSAAGIVQRVNRDGVTVRHDSSKLSAIVKVGDMVEIFYRGGRGEVVGAGKDPGLER